MCGCKEVDLLSVCNVVREPALPLPWWRGWLTKMCNVYIHYTAYIWVAMSTIAVRLLLRHQLFVSSSAFAAQLSV